MASPFVSHVLSHVAHRMLSHVARRMEAGAAPPAVRSP
jgi:hypothetical protein